MSKAMTCFGRILFSGGVLFTLFCSQNGFGQGLTDSRLDYANDVERASARANQATDDSGSEPSPIVGIAARPLRKDPLRYPSGPLRLGQEGCVELSFMLSTDGRVIDPIVTDSIGIRAFEKKSTRNSRFVDIRTSD